ncbi:MAG: PilZ domain-containing protein [Desulfarculaceae bacterium]
MDVRQGIMEGRERRQSCRHSLSQPVMVREAMAPVSEREPVMCLLGQTKDISSWGVNVKLDKPGSLQVGEAVNLRLYPLAGQPFVEAQGTIRWMGQTMDPIYPLEMGVDLEFFNDLSSLKLWSKKIEVLAKGPSQERNFLGGLT